MMKTAKYLLLKGFLFYSVAATAQVSPLGSYDGNIRVNYVRTWTATAPETNSSSLESRPVKDVRMVTQYVDGLGRLLQTVAKQGSLETGGSATDIVSPVVYDGYGRQQYNYLPYVSSQTMGDFKSHAFSQQVDFYNAQLAGQTGETYTGSYSLNWAYSKTVFEASPLSRVTSSYAPGASWVGSETNGTPRPVSVSHQFNTSSNAVRLWKVTNNTGTFGTYSVDVSIGNYSGLYENNSLYKTITTDEHGKQVVEFKDKEGKIILKKVQLENSVGEQGYGSGHWGWLCTYYIYDDENNLRCVVQPKAVELMDNSTNWTLSQAMLDDLCFRYEYDAKGRMSMKKVPGAGAVYMVYDERDRLVMTQDANMRATSKWMYTTYDIFNRPVSTGLINDGNTLAYHTSAAIGNVIYPNLSNYTPDELTRTFYDNYSWLSSYGSPLSATYDNSYDTYFQPLTGNWPYAQGNTATSNQLGMATGSRIKVLGSNTYLYTVTIYDDKGKPIQVKGTNITGSTDIATTQYTWAGQPLVMIQKIQITGGGAQTSVVVTQMSYDDLGRVLKTEKRVSNTLVNSNIMHAYKTIAENEYDKLGQLKKKKLAPSYNSNAGLENLNYEYNIRGWLLGVNREYARDANNSNYFGFDLGYDKQNNNLVGSQTYNAAQFNGNITGMVWKSKGDGEKRKYDFGYDAANRLLSADFNQYTGGSFNKTAGVDFSLAGMTYDVNGNITTMNQKGLKIGGSDWIDQLSYSYEPTSNKVQYITDGANDNLSKLGDFKYDPLTKTYFDYTYDVNGNMVADKNKNISSISYNHLNLPQTVTTTKGTITYTYDAAGNKIKKEVAETGLPVKSTLYSGGAVYENDVLQLIGHDEGRIRFKPAAGSTGASLQYDYMLKDHLGNVRMVLTEELNPDPYPAATMEPTAITNEEVFYGNLSNTQYGKPSWFNDPLYPTSTKVAQVKNAPGIQKVGPNMVLKVMAGDSYDVRVASGWSSGTPATNSTTDVLSDLLNLLSTGVGNISGGKASPSQLQNSNSGLNAGLSSFMSGQTSSGTKPKAYLSWVLLDEQFKVAKDNSGNIIASGYSGFEQVGNSGATTPHVKNLTVAKSGYLYIYTSNEATNIDVFFDNLQVTHTRGPILEETHYYPFGLTMAGISSKALNRGLQNIEQTFQGQQIDEDLGLNWIQFKWRNHDPQIGRFIEIDPLSETYEYNSTYAFSENKVTGHVELEGLEAASTKETPQEAQERIYKKAVELSGIKNKEFNQKNPHLFTGTTVLTKGEDLSMGVKATVLGVKVEASTCTNEFDVVGIRDNKRVVLGTEENSGEKTSRTGDSFSIGVGPVSVNESEMTETKKTDGIVVSTETTTTQGATVRKVFSNKITNKTTNTTTNENGVELFGIKLGFLFGVEINVKVNINPGGGITPPPAGYGPVDNTATKPIDPRLQRL